ncbi:pseudouridylate synthase PUS7L [Rhinophrynus dorsalis]
MDKELPPNVFESLCYVSAHTGFFGTIKNSPADFVVTEIDISGHLVTQDHNKETVQITCKDNDHDSLKNKKSEPKNAKLNEISSDFAGLVKSISETSNEKLVNTPIDDVNGCASDLLNTLIDEAVKESLNHFACSIKSAWRAQIAGDHPPELSLGSFPDKIERANIHSAVRQTFPFLVTFTKDCQLLVKPNMDYQELCQLTSEEEADEFFTFLDAKVENSRFTFQPDACKEHRTAVHHFISKKFGKLLETKSFTEKDIAGQSNVSITVRFRERMGYSRKRKRTEDTNKQDIYTAFTLQKENLETLEAINYLSCSLGVLPSDFSYAGIKDKKAITYQEMVVKKITPERLQHIESLIERKGMKMYNLRSVNQHLHLGHLAGNHFSIIVRDIKTHNNSSSSSIQEKIEEAVHNVKNKGFLNYYGPQRFGKVQNGQSHEIGLALLKDEMENAVKLLFTPDALEDPVNNAKKFFLQTGDVKGTLALMPDYKIRERLLLRALNRYGMNHDGCVRGWLSIPHSMRIFYIHAFCSKVWNEAASYRFLMYGSKVVEGDLILCNLHANEKSLLSDRVHIVTAVEAESNMYSIHQVVLPMPGHSIKYPTNKVGQWYNESLAKVGLQECKFRVCSLQLNLPGCYRHIIKHPNNLSYELLLESKEEKENKTECIKNSSKQSLVIKFELDSSCYATVCLREMMKCNF